MLAVEKPGLVSVALRWTEEHFAMVKAALNAGAHVFCEKPFAMNLRESDELLALAEKNGLRIAVSHQMRMAPNVVALKERLGEVIDELVQMRAFGKQDSRAGGEDMLVLGTHLFDLMRMFAGEARRCSATIWSQGKLAKLEDRKKATEGIGLVLGDEIEAQFEFDRGVNGSFTSRAKLHEMVPHWRLELIGTRGSAMILADIEPQVRVSKAGKSEWTSFEDGGGGERGTAAANRRLAMDWLKAIEERREPTCSGANGAKAVEMVMAAYQAHLSGRRVELPLANREHSLG
jgi:predicted dehydrogenase